MNANENFFYGAYRNIKEAAWKLQIEHNTNSLPISVLKICKDLGIATMSYSEASDLIDTCGLRDHSTVNDGFVLFTDKWYILYSDSVVPAGSVRFIAARELSRALLGHSMIGKKVGYFSAYYSNENLDPKAEDEATTLASKLLAPACVLWALNITEPEMIADICGLTPYAAELRSKRIKDIIQKKRFLTHPLERAVYGQFENYIKNFS